MYFSDTQNRSALSGSRVSGLNSNFSLPGFVLISSSLIFWCYIFLIPRITPPFGLSCFWHKFELRPIGLRSHLCLGFKVIPFHVNMNGMTFKPCITKNTGTILVPAIHSSLISESQEPCTVKYQLEFLHQLHLQLSCQLMLFLMETHSKFFLLSCLPL